jgi:hypothetical protein
MLQDAIVACEKINQRKGDIILKAISIINEI